MAGNHARQRALVYAFMIEHGHISQNDATKMGITRLAAVIKQLKDAGVKIGDYIQTGKNQYGDNTWWKEYYVIA